jgi:hypothetical protein
VRAYVRACVGKQSCTIFICVGGIHLYHIKLYELLALRHGLQLKSSTLVVIGTDLVLMSIHTNCLGVRKMSELRDMVMHRL